MTGRLAYIIIESKKTDNGEFIPCILKEGETGYYPTDYHWGDDLEIAQQCADELNKKMGLTDEDILQLLLDSMKVEQPFNPAT